MGEVLGHNLFGHLVASLRGCLNTTTWVELRPKKGPSGLSSLRDPQKSGFPFGFPFAPPPSPDSAPDVGLSPSCEGEALGRRDQRPRLRRGAGACHVVRRGFEAWSRLEGAALKEASKSRRVEVVL